MHSNTLADYYDYTYDPDCTSDAIVLPLSDIKDVHTIIPMLGGTGKKITAIKINNNKITDLTPLEKIPSITTLILDAQQAKNMDKSGIVIPRQISTIKVISENFSFFKKSILNYFKRIDMEENKVATQRIIFTLVFERIKNEKTK